MSRHQKITCDCGGELSRPIPTHCPHCGAQLIGYRHSMWSWLLPLLVVGSMFAALVAVLFWIVPR